MPTLSLDFETRSPVDLPAAGLYRYATDKDTDVLCFAWAFDDEEPTIWTPHMKPEEGVRTYREWPERILKHIAAGGEMRAWNASFERMIWREILVKRYHFPAVKDEQWVCTAAEAAAMALPRSLDQAAAALGAAQQKDKLGYKLMMTLSQPKTRRIDGTFEWHNDPEMLEKLYAYCQQDVRTERAIVPRLRRLTPTERQVYLLDQRMNDRGVRMDRPLVLAAQALALEGTRRAEEILFEATGGVVTGLSQHARLKKWLEEQGHPTESTDKAAVQALLAEALKPNVRAALTARAEAGRSSVKKLEAMLAMASPTDDRMRGMLLYHGATTGRWSGKGVQPQNFLRPELENPEAWIPDILAGDYDALDALYPPVGVVASVMRSTLCAAPGHTFVGADYSAIEARVVNWLAGQDDMLELFRQFDAASPEDKPNFDPYRHNASRLYNIPLPEVQKFPHRHTGKFQELGCGFGMGWRKAITAGKDVYQIDLTPEMAQQIVDDYRASHPKVKAFWYETEDACKQAVLNPGTVVAFGAKERLKAVKAGGHLYIILPSGRPLCYPAPRIVEAETPWSRDKREAAKQARALAELMGEPLPELPAPETRPALEFSSVDNLTKQWGRERTYGGKLVENITQAVARDIMAEAMLRAEAAGFPPVLTVHDEVLAEVRLDPRPDDVIVAQYEHLLATPPAWADGCPIAAEGWAGLRYRK